MCAKIEQPSYIVERDLYPRAIVIVLVMNIFMTLKIVDIPNAHFWYYWSPLKGHGHDFDQKLFFRF